jgi:WD40 repeat protein
VIKRVTKQLGVVTCMAVDGDVLVTGLLSFLYFIIIFIYLLFLGSTDQTVLVWDTSYVTKSSSVVHTYSTKHEPEDPLFILRGIYLFYLLTRRRLTNFLLGHDDVIQAVAVSIDMDIVVSGARDGTCIIHSLKSGKYIRSLSLSDSVDLVKISATGIPFSSKKKKKKREIRPNIYKKKNVNRKSF